MLSARLNFPQWLCRRTSVRRALCFSLSTISLLALSAITARADQWTKTYPISGRARVHVATNDGQVRIMTNDSKEVSIRVETWGMKISDREVHANVRQEGDRIDADVRVPNMWCVFCARRRSLKIEIHMPREGDLSVETGDGSVESDALAGNVDIHTGDGHIKLDGAKGEIRLRTGDGHIEARNLDGQLEAKSGDGHIRIAGRFDGLNLNTGDGSIDARVLPGSRISSTWSVHTGDGSVDLTLPDDFRANLEAHTNDGRISLGFPVTVEGGISKTEVRGKINGGGALLTVRTGDGSIRLMKS